MNEHVHIRRAALAATLASVLSVAWATGCGGATAEQDPKAGSRSPQRSHPGEVAFDQAKAAADAGDWRRAAALFAEAAERFNGVPAPAPAATTDTAEGQPAVAPKAPAAPEVRPEDARKALVNQGVALQRAGDLEAAARIYRQILEAAPHDPDAAATLARTQVALGRIEEASATIARALEAHPDAAPLLNLRAGLLRQQGKLDQAIEVARKVLLRDQQNAAAIKTLALVYADQGKLQLAETFFRNALKLDAKDATLYVNLGLLAFKRDEHQVAMLEFQRALELDPGNAAALANIGAIALRFRDYVRAADAYRQAISAGMVNCTTVSALGYALQGQQDGAAAVEQLGKAFEMCPKDHELLYTMGLVCAEQLRDNDCALEHFERYKREKPGLASDHAVYRYIESIKAQQAAEQDAPPPAGELPPEANERASAPESQAPPTEPVDEPHSRGPTLGEVEVGGGAMPQARARAGATTEA